MATAAAGAAYRRCTRASLRCAAANAVRRAFTGLHTTVAHESRDDVLRSLLSSTEWLLPSPSSTFTELRSNLVCIRDDLLCGGPVGVTGNKARKLDSLFPALPPITTCVVTCGGLHSAHAPAVAAACKHRGLRCVILVRADPPPTRLVGHAADAAAAGAELRFVDRDTYARREEMLSKTASELGDGAAVIPEGCGASPASLIGLIRAARSWSEGDTPLGGGKRVHLVVDAGTGSTAYGLALAAWALRLPWRVTAVAVGGTVRDIASRCKVLAGSWAAAHPALAPPPGALHMTMTTPQPLRAALSGAKAKKWRFGVVEQTDADACSDVEAQCGVPVDPVWTLWPCLEAHRMADEAAQQGHEGEEVIAWVHAGGVAGAWAGVRERFPA